jgi:3-(3-hydroxy-phenyl)propionate hydroxylase
VTWISSYQFLQVVADQFVDPYRRVVLVGEAAHLFAPFGARGMNSGIVDAVEAAEAIRIALEGSRDDGRAALERFAERRQAAARYNRDAAGLALQHIQGQSAVLNLKRQLAAWVAPWSSRAGRWLDEGPYGPKSGPPQLATKY